VRKPDLIIGDPPQTKRWHLFRWRGIQVALHRWLRSDNDRALHDHSADNISILLTGVYWEWFSHAWEPRRRKLRFPLIPYYRKAETMHRVQLGHGPVWSIWIRFKPRREWGFRCPQGWRHWKDFLDQDYTKYPGSVSNIGRGCG